MKLNVVLGLMTVASIPFMSACDDEPPPPALLQFVDTEIDVKESTGDPESFHPALLQDATGTEVKITLSLDKPAAETSVVAFSVSGTADATSAANPIGDYGLEGSNFTIEKGATEAVLTLTVYEDTEFEDDAENDEGLYFEDIVITLTNVVSGPVQIGEGSTVNVNILEDDVEIDLTWDNGNGNAGDVDLDLYLWIGEELLTGSAAGGTQFEEVLLPGGFFNETFGVSYTYYGGTSNTVTLTSTITNHGGEVNGESGPHETAASYTLANINVYDNPDDPNHKGNPMVVQYLEKDGHDLEAGPINVPPSGSRIGHAPTSITDRTSWAEVFKTYLQRRSAD